MREMGVEVRREITAQRKSISKDLLKKKRAQKFSIKMMKRIEKKENFRWNPQNMVSTKYVKPLMRTIMENNLTHLRI